MLGRILKFSFLLFTFSFSLASCSNDDIVPDTPEQPSVSKYEQLTFSTADENAGKAATRAVWSDPNGKGNLFSIGKQMRQAQRWWLYLLVKTLLFQIIRRRILPLMS